MAEQIPGTKEKQVFYLLRSNIMSSYDYDTPDIYYQTCFSIILYSFSYTAVASEQALLGTLPQEIPGSELACELFYRVTN